MPPHILAKRELHLLLASYLVCLSCLFFSNQRSCLGPNLCTIGLVCAFLIGVADGWKPGACTYGTGAGRPGNRWSQELKIDTNTSTDTATPIRSGLGSSP